jgi:diacylglycerol kinase (ATP)
MRARLIANPKSGSDRASSLLPAAAERLRTLVTDLDITITTGEHDIERAATRAVDEGCDLLFVAGGDGTLNIAVRAVAATAGGLDRIAFGVIPLGTGNDFAKALGLGEDPDAALDELLDPRVVAVDLGLLNDRPFVNVSAGGFVAEVSDSASEGLKDATGKLAYLIAGAMALLGTEPFSTRLVIHDDRAAPIDGPALDLQMFAVCNARLIGGGYEIASDALVDDGVLDVLVVPRMTRLELVATLQRLASGDAAADRGVRRFRSGRFDLEFDRPVRVNTDGEVNETDRCQYRVLARAARFFAGNQVARHMTSVPVTWGSS